MAEARDDLAREWLERARRSLHGAELLAAGGEWNDCVSRLYYACFDAVRALLLQQGFRFSKHSSVHGLFNQHFGKTGAVAPDLIDLYNTLYRERDRADYSPFVRFEESTVRPWLADAARFITTVEELVQSRGNG